MMGTSTSVADTLVKVLSNHGLWAAIISSLVVTGLGFIVAKMGLVSKQMRINLNKLVLLFCLPLLGFIAFMRDPDAEEALATGIILGISAVYFLLAGLVAQVYVRFFPRLLPTKVLLQTEQAVQTNLTISNFGAEQRQTIIAALQRKLVVSNMLMIYASVTFFALPLVMFLYGTTGVAHLNTFSIPFQIGLYTHAKLGVGEEKMNVKDLKKTFFTIFNPVVVLLLISLSIWGLSFIPGKIYKLNWEIVDMAEQGFGFWNLSRTFPAFFDTMRIIATLSSPLIWIGIGGSLYGVNLKNSLKSKFLWSYTTVKLLIMPLAFFVLCLVLVPLQVISVDIGVILVIMAAAPPAASIVLYAQSYDNQATYASEVSTLSTTLCFITIPFWIILSQIIFEIIK